jgi:micrococcal nuclease
MSNKKRFKLPIGCLLAAGILATICGIVVPLSTLASLFSLAPAATLDTNGIATAAFQTALALNLETQAAASSFPEPTSAPSPFATDTGIALPTSTEVVIPVTGADCIPDNPPQTGVVVDVVDGDTIKVLLDEDGQTYSVRYIGMDTPENTGQVEYFGPEATAKNAELVYGKSVTLIKDVSETDQYGRLLRYIIADGVFVNYELVAQGYANTASFPPDVACIPTFQAVEQRASTLKLGLWGAPPTQVILLPLPTAPSGGSGGSSGNAPCDCSGPDLDCPDFGYHTAAQACYNYCVSQGYGDVFRLDRDIDGSACEDLP